MSTRSLLFSEWSQYQISECNKCYVPWRTHSCLSCWAFRTSFKNRTEYSGCHRGVTGKGIYPIFKTNDICIMIFFMFYKYLYIQPFPILVDVRFHAYNRIPFNVDFQHCYNGNAHTYCGCYCSGMIKEPNSRENSCLVRIICNYSQ